LHWVKAQIEKFDRTAHRKKRAKKDRSSAPVNPDLARKSNSSSFPGLASTGLPPKALAASDKPGKAQNSSKLIVAIVSPFKSSKV
jgi:hypothetical protein